MRLIANGTQVPSAPVPNPVIGTPGYGTDGNAGTGPEASIVDQDTFNSVLLEIMAVITAGGASGADPANNAQLLAALLLLFPRRTEIRSGIASSGFLVLPGYLGGGKPKIVFGSAYAPATNLTTSTKDIVFPDGFSLSCNTVAASCYTPSYTNGGADSVWANCAASLITTAGFRAVIDNLNFQGGAPVINRVVGFSYIAIGADQP